MSQQDNISLNITDEDMTEINNAIKTLKTKLLPHLKTITNAERIEIPKMGDKTVAFVSKALDYCITNKEFVPPYLDVEAFKIDVRAVEILRSMKTPISQILEAIDDSDLLSGSEAYIAALLFYNSVKVASKSKITNAETIYNDLSVRFQGRPSKTDEK
jgi:hypothetical protein